MAPQKKSIRGRWKDLSVGFVAGFLGFLGADMALEAFESPYAPPGQSQAVPAADFRQPLTIDNCMVVMNEKRLEAGSKSLPTNPEATRDAQLRADDIHSGRSPYDHSGKRKYEQDGTFRTAYGEILSQGRGCRAAMDGFMESPTHRAIMLDPEQKYAGVGISGNTLVVLFHK